MEELDERLPGFDQQLKLHVTGCPNSCGQHWIADIGLEGKKIKVDGRLQDAYYFCVGGAVGQASGHRAAGRIPLPGHRRSGCDRAAAACILGSAPAGREPAPFFARLSDAEIRGFLAGIPMVAVERDLPHRQAVARGRGLMHERQLFPMFVKLAGRKCLVVGGGPVAEGKVEGLLASGAAVVVVAPEVTGKIARLECQDAVSSGTRASSSRPIWTAHSWWLPRRESMW